MNSYRSIDEYIEDFQQISLEPETEFWCHCSNIQAWVENNYDTNILTYSLSFPILKKLTEFRDPIAKNVFKEEIAKRYSSGYKAVKKFLKKQGYLEFLTKEELSLL